MPLPTQKTFGVYELTEQILLHLDDHLDIIRAQRVCRAWRNVIQTSPALQEACWYQPDTTEDAQMQPVTAGGEVWKLNPAFNRIGVSVSKDTSTNADWVGQLQDKGDFSLEEQIYDEPGSWTTMLATQPPCQRMLVECYSDYSHDQTMTYLIVSMTSYLLMGDIMAVLAECQNRQRCGLDRWTMIRHYTGRLIRWEGSGWDSDNWAALGAALDRMLDDVSIKVAVELPWGEAGYPVFSLRRLHHNSKDFLHEMILHRMITEEGPEFQWDPRHTYKSVRHSEYKANLLVIREYQEGYLSYCSHIFRLVSDIEQECT